MLNVTKNKHQQGRGYFSTVSFNGRMVAEMHVYDGQVLTPVLQLEQVDQMAAAGVPVSREDNTILWSHAYELLAA